MTRTKPVPYLVVPAEPPYRPFQVRRPVLPRPVCFGAHPRIPGDWPYELLPHKSTSTYPFDTTPMACPYGEVGDGLQVKIKGASTAFRRNLIDVRLVAVTCEHGPGHEAEWVLTLERT